MKTYHLKMKDIANRSKIGTFDLSKWSEWLGDDLPNIMMNRIGRFRLLQLLRRKYGANFKNVGQCQQILKAFDSQMKARG